MFRHNFCLISKFRLKLQIKIFLFGFNTFLSPQINPNLRFDIVKIMLCQRIG